MIDFHSIRAYSRKVGWITYFLRTSRRQFYKRLLRSDLKIRLPTGLSLHLPRESHYASEVWLTRGHVDDGCEEILLHALRPDQDFLDVGAHLGYYSLWCAPAVRCVHAFEPDPRNHNWLRQNAEQTTNIVARYSAVSDFSGEIALCQDVSSAQSHVVDFSKPEQSQQRCVRVPCTTIDAYWAQQERPSICALKVDVEGHEIAVLAGAREVFTACRPIGLIETCFQNVHRLRLWSASVAYRSFAIVRLRQRTEIVEINEGFDSGHDFTMAFLVPNERADAWLQRRE